MGTNLVKILIFGPLAAGLLATTAAAHHGWAWAEDEQMELTGTITGIYIGPPHPRLEIETADGAWTIDLGNPRQTERAGFVEGEAEEGDEVTAIGNRSRDQNEMLLKAVRITIDGRNYDLYPERIRD